MASKLSLSVLCVCISIMLLSGTTEAGPTPKSLREDFAFVIDPIKNSIESVKKSLEDISAKIKENPIYKKAGEDFSEVFEAAKKPINKLYESLDNCAQRCETMTTESNNNRISN